MQFFQWAAQSLCQDWTGEEFQPFGVHSGDIGQGIAQCAATRDFALPQAIQ